MFPLTPVRHRPPARGHPSVVRVLRTAAEVQACAASWERHVPAGDLGPLTRPAWFGAAAAALAPAGRLRVVVVEEDGAVVAAAPLVAGAGGRLELLGGDALPEPGDLAARDATALGVLARGVVGLGRPIRLPRVPADSPTIAALRAAAGRGGWVPTRPADPWPTLSLHPGWAGPDGLLSARRAADLRRAARRAEAAGGVDTVDHHPGPADVGPLLDLALAIEASGWKGRSRTALVHDPVRLPFFRAWATRAARDGSLRIAVLRIGGEPAAVQIAAESANRRWILKIGHGDEHARCSPGLLLLLHTVREAARRGLDGVELLGTVEPWTTAWTTEARATRLVRVYPGNAAGAGRLARDGSRAMARRAAERRAAAAAARSGTPGQLAGAARPGGGRER